MGRVLNAGLRMSLRQAMWQGQLSRPDFRALITNPDIMAELHDHTADMMTVDGVDPSDEANLLAAAAVPDPNAPAPTQPKHPILAWLAAHLPQLLTLALEVAKAFGLNITIPTLAPLGATA
jgi:hypothetical protein